MKTNRVRAQSKGAGVCEQDGKTAAARPQETPVQADANQLLSKKLAAFADHLNARQRIQLAATFDEWAGELRRSARSMGMSGPEVN